MTWDRTTLASEGAPKWYQTAEILRRAILDGEFGPGATLPTEAQLTDAFGISRTTARTALSKLVEEGLIFRRSGVGSVVRAERVDRPVSHLQGFTEDMRGRGLEPSFEVVDLGWQRASGEVSQALGTASSDMTFRSVRLLLANERIMGYSESWIRADVFGCAAPPGKSDLANGSLYDWLRTRRGIEITGGVEFIEAGSVSEAIAGHLQIAPGSPVLVATRIARSSRGLPIEFAVVTYRSDRYRFRIDL